MAYENCPFTVTPYDTSRLVKNTNLVNINYTNQDFWSMKTRLVDYIKQNFADKFNDFVESDLAIMLIENWAFIADTLSFKIDQVANEIFIDTVSEVDNAFRLCQFVGFKPLPPIAATSMWAVTIQSPLETDLEIPTPIDFTFSAVDGTRYMELFPVNSSGDPMFNQSIYITAGSVINTSVIGLEGKTNHQSAIGSGEINQFMQLNANPVIWNSVRVMVDGVEWTQVDYFTDSQPRREFRVEYDPEYRGFVLFGNSRAGMIPAQGAVIDISFRTGGGTAGNIVTGAIETQRGITVGGFDFPVQVTFRNYTKGENGYDGDTIEDIKRKLPYYIRTQNRAVTGDDYQSLAENFATAYHGQIGKALAVLRQYGCAANVVDLYVLARDGDQNLIAASNELKSDLSEEVNSKKVFTDYVCIKDGVVVEVDTHLDVTLDKFYRKFEEELRVRVERRITNFFSLNNWEFEQTLQSIDIIKELSDIKEIRSVDVTFVTDNESNSGTVVTTKFYEIIRPATTEINFVYE